MLTLNLFSAVFKKEQYEVHKIILVITLKRKIIIALPFLEWLRKTVLDIKVPLF